MVDRPNSKLYAEDVFGAMMIDCSALEEIPFEVGDEITDMFFTISTLGKLTYLEPMIPDVGRLLSKNNTITPTDLTLSEFMQTPDYYIYRLISIVDGTFADAEGKTFSTSPLTLAAGDASTQVKPFAGTDLIGTEVPTAHHCHRYHHHCHRHHLAAARMTSLSAQPSSSPPSSSLTARLPPSTNQPSSAVTALSPTT